VKRFGGRKGGGLSRRVETPGADTRRVIRKEPKSASGTRRARNLKEKGKGGGLKEEKKSGRTPLALRCRGPDDVGEKTFRQGKEKTKVRSVRKSLPLLFPPNRLRGKS